MSAMLQYPLVFVDKLILFLNWSKGTVSNTNQNIPIVLMAMSIDSPVKTDDSVLNKS